MAAKEPGEHSEGGAAPPPHDEPAGQSRHSGSPLRSVSLAYVPASHCASSSRDDPTGQNLPAAQRTQAAAAGWSW